MGIVVTSSEPTENTAPEAEAVKSEDSADETNQKSASGQEPDETAEESDASEAKEGKAAKDSESDDSEESDQEEEQESKAEKPKRGNGFKKRIDKLRAQNSAKDQEIEYWRQKALSEQKPEKADDAIKSTAPEGKPKADDFETHEDYIEAVADWKAEQKLAAYEAKQRENQVKTEHEKRVSTHAERVEAFKEKHEDFDDVLADVADVRVSLAVQELILESDNGPELMYALAKEPEELERICKLSPLQAAREMGKFESRLTKSGSPKEIKTTKAPKPVNPVGGGGSGGAKKSIYDPGISQQEYEALRREQMKKRASAWG